LISIKTLGASTVGNKAFMRLFKYITGNNTSQKKVIPLLVSQFGQGMIRHLNLGF